MAQRVIRNAHKPEVVGVGVIAVEVVELRTCRHCPRQRPVDNDLVWLHVLDDHRVQGVIVALVASQLPTAKPGSG
ncbi:hypothetical protein D3C76_1322450 [compost metagenome]